MYYLTKTFAKKKKKNETTNRVFILDEDKKFIVSLWEKSLPDLVML